MCYAAPLSEHVLNRSIDCNVESAKLLLSAVELWCAKLQYTLSFWENHQLNYILFLSNCFDSLKVAEITILKVSNMNNVLFVRLGNSETTRAQDFPSFHQGIGPINPADMEENVLIPWRVWRTVLWRIFKHWHIFNKKVSLRGVWHFSTFSFLPKYGMSWWHHV